MTFVTPLRRLLLVCLVIALPATVLTGCQSSSGGGTEVDGRLRVATTVAPITSIVGQIAGSWADVIGIVPEGVNSHTFEPRPSDAELLSTADVVFLNGLGLEEPTAAMAAANVRNDARVIELGTQLLAPQDWIFDFSFPEADGVPNPHLWTEPKWVRAYAALVTDTLAQADPVNAGHYAENYARLDEAIDLFEVALDRSLETVPTSERRLLTYHDSFAYFARERGWEVLGAIQVSDFGEPTPREVGDLIEQVRASGVRAIFGSEVFPSPVLEQIGQETGVRYLDVLRDDDLPGEPGQVEHSLLGLLRFDYVTIVEALGGDAASLRAWSPARLPDLAEYAQ